MTAVPIERIMSTPVVSVTPAMHASDALELAYEHRVHHLPVVDHGRAVGIVCTCDLEDVAPTTQVFSSMRSPPISMHPRALAPDALDLMNTHRIGSLVVVDGERLLGIVTRQDLLKSGTPMFEDPRGFCSCCGSIAHLRPHATGALCSECWGRSGGEHQLDHGGGD